MDDLFREAKKKALRILERKDCTETELRLKLKQKGCSEEEADEAISYVKSFHYVDDESYAVRYAESKKLSKSRKEIYMLLCQKGIEKEVIESALTQCYNTYSEVQTIQYLFEKKKLSVDESTEEEKQKFYHYLLRRGFRGEEIRQVIQVSFWNA